MNLNGCEKYFGFAVYVRIGINLRFVCLNLPDKNGKCLGIQVNSYNIPESSLLYILKLNELDQSIVDDFEIYIPGFKN